MNLLEEQYRRGEKVRLKNKQKERLLHQDIESKGGLRDVHKYRMEVVNREQKEISKELDRIRQGIKQNLTLNSQWADDNKLQGLSPHGKWRRGSVLSNKSLNEHRINGQKKNAVTSKNTSHRYQEYSESPGKDQEDRSYKDGTASESHCDDEGEYSPDNESDTSDSSTCTDDDYESIPDVNILNAIMSGIVSNWEKTMTQKFSNEKKTRRRRDDGSMSSSTQMKSHGDHLSIKTNAASIKDKNAYSNNDLRNSSSLSKSTDTLSSRNSIHHHRGRHSISHATSNANLNRERNQDRYRDQSRDRIQNHRHSIASTMMVSSGLSKSSSRSSNGYATTRHGSSLKVKGQYSGRSSVVSEKQASGDRRMSTVYDSSTPGQSKNKADGKQSSKQTTVDNKGDTVAGGQHNGNGNVLWSTRERGTSEKHTSAGVGSLRKETSGRKGEAGSIDSSKKPLRNKEQMRQSRKYRNDRDSASVKSLPGSETNRISNNKKHLSVSEQMRLGSESARDSSEKSKVNTILSSRSDGCRMDTRQMPDGCRMDTRQMPDGRLKHPLGRRTPVFVNEGNNGDGEFYSEGHIQSPSPITDENLELFTHCNGPFSKHVGQRGKESDHDAIFTNAKMHTFQENGRSNYLP